MALLLLFFFYFQQMLMLLRQAVCYIFVLTDEEKNMVHTNTGLRNLEVKKFHPSISRIGVILMSIPV